MADSHEAPKNSPSAAATNPLPSARPDRDFYTIPLRSSWFRWDEIHDTERKALPEFFGSTPHLSRNPRVYKEYRDFIINKYREDPSRRITFTEIRKSLVGDVGLLRKVFDFLDSCGLVNFSAASGAEEVLPAVSVEEGLPGGIKVHFPHSAKGIEPPSRVTGSSGRKVGGMRAPPLSSYSDVFTDADGAVCGYCGEMCSGGLYRSKKGGLPVCMKCFKEEKHKETNSEVDLEFSGDVEGSERTIRNEWADVETLHILESVIAKRNDWALISDQVKRNKLDCIAKLIQLPFGEHMSSFVSTIHSNNNLRTKESNLQRLDKHENGDLKHSESYAPADSEDINEEKFCEPLAKRRCITFPDASISLMDQVADLSTVAGPHVATSAAEAAIAALCSENVYARKVFKTGNSANEESASRISDAWPKRESKDEDNLSQDQLKVLDTSNSTPEKSFVHLTFQMRAAIATALGSVAARAKMLADQEDREIELLISTILEMQVKKLQFKIKHFEELELIMEKEYTHMQQLKDTMLAEWVRILQLANEAGLLKWREQGFSKSLQVNPG